VRFLGLLLAVIVAGCLEANSEAGEGAFSEVRLAQARLRSEVLGCFELLEANGRALDSSRAFSAARLIRLQPDTVPDYPSGVMAFHPRRAVSLLSPRFNPEWNEKAEAWGWTVWIADSLSDSVRIAFSTGFSGTVVVLNYPRSAHDALSGRIEERWDTGPSPTSNRRVRAVRRECPAKGAA